MKLISAPLLLISVFALSGCFSQQSSQEVNSRRVFIILRETETSRSEEFLETAETATITRLLEKAGFQVTVASRSGGTFTCPYTLASFKSIRLAKARASDYVALIIPSNKRKSQYYDKEAIESECAAIVRQAVRRKKIVAAQRWGIVVLAEAGVLAGRQYAFPVPADDQRFAKATRDSRPLVQDGRIITCSLCPFANPGFALTNAVISSLGN